MKNNEFTILSDFWNRERIIENRWLVFMIIAFNIPLMILTVIIAMSVLFN